MPGREAHRRRVLRLDVRELRARPARARRGRGPHPAAVDAPLRRLRDHLRAGCAAPAGGPGRGTRGRHSHPGRARLHRARRSRSARISCPRAHRNPTARDAARSGSRWTATVRRGFPTPSGRLEFYSSTLADWGWPEHALPGYIKSHVHPDRLAPGQLVLLSTFRLPTQIHTRSANAKWLDELAHTNPVWIHPSATPGGSASRAPATWCGWRPTSATSLPRRGSPKGSGPGWSPAATTWGAGGWQASPGQRAMMATVDLRQGDDGWTMERRAAGGTVRVQRPGHPADLVERHRRPPEPHLPRPPRPDLRHALLAPGGAGAPRRPWRSPRRHRGGHQQGAGRVPGVAAADPPGRAAGRRAHCAGRPG